MSKASQLATRDKNTAQRLVDLVSAHDRAVTQSTAQAVADAMWRYFDQDRILIKGGECNDGVTYCQVGNAVLKVCSQSISGALSYNVARNVVSCSRDRVTVSIAPATEAELLDAWKQPRAARDYGSRNSCESFVMNRRHLSKFVS